MSKRNNRFTLVELLVVICIASLLMGVVLPAFNRMVTGSAVDRLASNLKLRLERAQSHAASSRRHVAVVLPHGDVSGWSSDEVVRKKLKNAALGGSRICYVDEVSTDDYSSVFSRWVPDEDWNTPERGAVVIALCSDDPVDDDGVLKTAIVNHISHNGDASVNILNGTGKGKPLKKINGIRFKDGDESDSGNDTEDAGIVFSSKGGIRSTADVYIVIAEAMLNGGKVIFPGGQINNFRVLKINRLTGKVEYHR